MHFFFLKLFKELKEKKYIKVFLEESKNEKCIKEECIKFKEFFNCFSSFMLLYF